MFGRKKMTMAHAFLELSERYANEARARGRLEMKSNLHMMMIGDLLDRVDERDTKLASMQRIKDWFQAENEQLIREAESGSQRSPPTKKVPEFHEVELSSDPEPSIIRPPRVIVRTAGCVSRIEVHEVLKSLGVLATVAAKNGAWVSSELLDAMEQTFGIISDANIPRARVQTYLIDALAEARADSVGATPPRRERFPILPQDESENPAGTGETFVGLREVRPGNPRDTNLFETFAKDMANDPYRSM